jgi:hypothetical protein
MFFKKGGYMHHYIKNEPVGPEYIDENGYYLFTSSWDCAISGPHWDRVLYRSSAWIYEGFKVEWFEDGAPCLEQK